MTSAAKKPCKNKAFEGLEIDGKCVCKNHWQQHMLTIKLNEIAASKPPVVEEPVNLIPCISKTKDGKACRHPSIKDCDGMCKIHFEAVKRASAPPSPAKEKPKCTSQTKDNKPCANYQKDGCNNMCNRCFNRIQNEEKAAAEKEAKKNKPKATSTISITSEISKSKQVLLASLPPPMQNDAEEEEETEEAEVIQTVSASFPAGF
jgi:hypothetical protein